MKTEPSPWLTIKDADSLTPEILASLQAHAHGLSLPLVTHLSDDLAAQLARYPGDLALDALETIRPRTAWMLVTPSGSGITRVLSLNGLTDIDHLTAEAFAVHRGGLSLDGIRQLRFPAARLLCRTDGALSLRGLSSITAMESACLANRAAITLLANSASLGPEAHDMLADNSLVRFAPVSPAPRDGEGPPEEIAK